MEALKKLFGVNIASFVEFCRENIDEDGKSKEKSLLQSLSREPISRDEQLVQKDKDEYDSHGMLNALDRLQTLLNHLPSCVF